MHNHSFYLTLAYGVGALLLALELALLMQRCRRARKIAEE